MNRLPAHRVPKLYGIADGDALGFSPADLPNHGPDPVTRAVIEMAEAGVRWIQIRLKSVDDRTMHRVVESCVRRLEGSSAQLWINDRVDLAALFPSMSVHVGQDDLAPSAARRVLSPGQWIGLSCHDELQIRQGDGDDAVDVLACGPVFTTTSKSHPDPTIGIAGVQAARALTRKPLVAIGGIELSNALQVLAAGADSVVVLGALCRGDVARNSRRWVAALEDS